MKLFMYAIGFCSMLISGCGKAIDSNSSGELASLAANSTITNSADSVSNSSSIHSSPESTQSQITEIRNQVAQSMLSFGFSSNQINTISGVKSASAQSLDQVKTQMLARLLAAKAYGSSNGAISGGLTLPDGVGSNISNAISRLTDLKNNKNLSTNEAQLLDGFISILTEMRTMLP